MDILLGLIIGLLTFIGYLVFKYSRILKYWEERNVPYIKPYIFVGNNLRSVLRLQPLGEVQKQVVEAFPNHPIVGFFDFTIPILLVKDPYIAEKILIKDFQYFVDRLPGGKDTNPLRSSLINMSGNRWRAMRNKISPMFTTGKLKNMFEQISNVGKQLTEVIEEGDLKCIDMGHLMERYTLDIIGCCAFGLEWDNMADENSEFHMMARKVLKLSGLQFAKLMIIRIFPSIAKALKLSFVMPQDTQEYFCGIIKNILEYRRSKGIHRNDFIDLMICLKEKGHIDYQHHDPSDDFLRIDSTAQMETVEITDNILIGQAFAFLSAGFEASAATASFACYEFSKNHGIQDRARSEICKYVKLNGGELDFEALQAMKYLDMCVKETMRKYPPSPQLFRTCTKEYIFENGIKIRPGQKVNVVILAIHMDPQYYPDPMKFDPERFSTDMTRPPCSYLPFGDGPRMCIAMRFAYLQLKFALAKILLNYKINLNPKTKEPLEFSLNSFLNTPKHPLYFDLTKLQLFE